MISYFRIGFPLTKKLLLRTPVVFHIFRNFKSKKKKLFCAFVDFEKAFDTVWRVALWYKLLLNNINGKMYNVILNTVPLVK
jgi:hypothetical protein